MKPEINHIEDSILLKKENVVEDKNHSFNIKSFIFTQSKNLIFSLTSISFISLFFLNNSIGFEKQLEFVNTRQFAGSLCILFSLFMILYILHDIIITARKGEMLSKKFSSVWLPIKFSILSFVFIPFEATTSIASSTIIETIKVLSKFF